MRKIFSRRCSVVRLVVASRTLLPCRCRSPANAGRIPGLRPTKRVRVLPVVRPIACVPATDAISRSRRSSNESRAAVCNNFCPASETKLVYGSSIDSAATEAGKPYSELPNAFRYRDEIVAGCTCNGKDPVELASIKVEDDPTLRKGDLVAAANRLMVAGRSAGQRGDVAEFLTGPATAQRALSARAGGGVVGGVVTGGIPSTRRQ